MLIKTTIMYALFVFENTKPNEREKKSIIFFVIVDIVCTYDMHLGDAHENCSGAYFVICIYLFVFLFWICCFSYLVWLRFVLLLLLHLFSCKLESHIILAVVAASDGSCDRVFGIYDYNTDEKKMWLEHQIQNHQTLVCIMCTHAC